MDDGARRLYSRRRTDLTPIFPELVDALAAQVSAGTVLDGELVIWRDGRLDFSALQQRMARGPRAAAALGRSRPASLVVFDVLASEGLDRRGEAFDDRRERLEEMARLWSPPLNLSPLTKDVDLAREWFATYTVAGLEGLVVKGGSQPYPTGTRGWIKVKNRRALDVVCGAVTGSLRAPQDLIVGLPIGGELRIVGRSTPLSLAARRSLAPWLELAEPGHPWPETLRAGAMGRWGDDHDVRLVRVEPVVVEVSADVAWSGRSFRHPVRLLRVRPDAEVGSVSPPEGLAPSGEA